MRQPIRKSIPKDLLKPYSPVVKVEKEARRRPFSAKAKPEEKARFLLWDAIPPQFLGKSAEQLELLGVRDSEIADLCQYKSQRAFCAAHKISERIVSKWRWEIAPSQSSEKLNKVLDQMTPRLMAAFALHMEKNPTPQSVETWHEIVKDRKKSIGIDFSATVALDDEAKEAIRKALGK